MSESLKVLVLGGGPDRERPVSLKSAAAVAAALRRAGHEVIEADISPDRPETLDTPCDVVFPVLHGRFGEGGPLQRMMDTRKLKYVGARSRAAAAAMDKYISKQKAEAAGVPTAAYQLLGPNTPITLDAPMVIKALTEGSSFGMAICPTMDEAVKARAQMLANFSFQMAERFIKGREITVGIVERDVLPAIQIVPAVEYYDYEAKYNRNDTRYEFDIDLPAETMNQIRADALKVYDAIGCRHLGRVDFIIDETGRHWFLEINTMPGFTDHSLLPMAANKAGMDMAALCDRLIRLALKDGDSR
ncbi:D-alanine--D-alanine ligase [Planctomycetales bacterium ZRK34]|nr:D-alanine--D-alanine ligase [Planctomycetales bacterium ZRK34]